MTTADAKPETQKAEVELWRTEAGGLVKCVPDPRAGQTRPAVEDREELDKDQAVSLAHPV